MTGALRCWTEIHHVAVADRRLKGLPRKGHRAERSHAQVCGQPNEPAALVGGQITSQG